MAQALTIAARQSGSTASVALSAGPLRFVPAAEAPAGEAYEAFIARTASVPTRDNLHDLFNGLVWLAFPQTKRRLNALQAAEIARLGVGATRGPLRDALTLFDENGAVLDAPPALREAMVARDWQKLFVAERALWAEARLLVVGHALLEKLLSQRKEATAHVLLAQPAIHLIANGNSEVEPWLARALDPGWLSQKPFAPLPVFGIPGWCAQNADPAFYDDRRVFRPAAGAIASRRPRGA